VDNHNKGYMKSLAMVHEDGNVFWPPIVRMRSSCKMDITYFPFDDQLCSLKLGSWAYDGFQVDVTNRSDNVDLSNYVDNGEWELLGTKVIRRVKFYTCCPEPFIDVTFYIMIRRRVLYYFLNVIIPCMMLSSLSLTGFLLPPESGEKVTLGLTVLLAFSVFMLLVAENMPPTSEYIPLIGLLIDTLEL
ncbi:neuronal acetylcholine receptor subunit alpha-10, partial [Elysia marginata]